MSNQIFPVIGAQDVTIVSPIPVPTQDQSDGTPGQPVPLTALQIAGSDGTDLQAVSTDTSGNVNVNVVNAPVVHVEGHAGGVLDAVVGAAVPANAIQVAGSDGTDLRALLTDSSGRQEVIGAAASGAAVTGNPVLVAGSDGTDARTLLTDNTGQLKVLVEGGTGIPVTGTVTAQIEGHAGGVLDAVVGAAIPANAILVGGSESGNIEPLLLDGSGFLKVNVAAGSSGNAAASPTGSAVPADADYLGASDGTNLIGLLVESTGNPNLRVGLFNGTHEAAVDAQGGVTVAGEAASGAAVTGNPVLVAGQDGTDARTLLTDNTGQLKVLVENGSAIAVSGTVTAEIEGHAGGVLDAVVGAAIPANAVLIGGNEAGNIEPLLLDASGFLKVNVAAGSSGNSAASATGSAVPADADYLGASDGTDLQGLLVESATHPNLRVALYNGAVEAVVDAQGGVKVSGEAASGSAVTGNPVLVAGQDGTDARTLLTDNTGQLKVLVEGGTGIPVTNAGTFAVQEATLDGAISGGKVKVSAAAGDVIVEVSDGTNIIGTTAHPVQVADQANGPVTPGTAAVKSELQGGVVATSAASGTNGQQMAVQLDVAGCVRINPAGQTGSFTTYHLSNPAVGTLSVTFTVPAGKKWRVSAVFIQLTTSSQAGSRFMEFYAEDASSNILTSSFSPTAQTASATQNYAFAPGVVDGGTTQQKVSIPAIALGPGASVTMLVSGGKTADQLALPTLTVEEYND